MQAQPPPGMMPGQMPSPEQIEAMRRQLAIDAEKAGMTIPEFIEHLKRQAMEQQMRMRQMQAQQGQQPQQGQQGGQPAQGQQTTTVQPQPIVPGPPNPIALSLAKFLKSQELKPRVCILNGQRKEMFRVKRALRAIQSPAYEKARKKNPALPEITDRASLENTFKLLPMSMLALRVEKVPGDSHEGHNHKKAKRVKGQWDLRIVPQQEAHDDMYYVWMWEGSQVKNKIYAALAVLIIFAVVCYPLWPLKMRQGVYYLSWGFLGLLGLFFLMAIFRVILFCITYFAVPPGLWLFPNLWEDVSFLDSFKPVWAWHETAKKKKKKTTAKGSASAQATFSAATGQPLPATATTTATATQITTQPQQRTYVAPRVEELADDE